MLSLFSTEQLLQKLAASVRANRQSKGWSVAELAERSGVAISTIKRFERSGIITSDRLLMLLLPLRMTDSLMEAVESRAHWTLEQHEHHAQLQQRRQAG